MYLEPEWRAELEAQQNSSTKSKSSYKKATEATVLDEFVE